MGSFETPSTSRPKIALVSGYWGTNIGNAFFNIGGMHAVRSAFEDHDVVYIHDQPGYWTFHRKDRGNPKNAFSMIESVKADFIVIQGPVFTSTFPQLWGPTLRALRSRGVGVLMLGAALFRYSVEEIDAAKAMLREYPPIALSTRDQPTFDALSSAVEHAHDGVDSAFFVADAFQPVDLEIEPYVVANFDRRPEPSIRIHQPDTVGALGRDDLVFDALGTALRLRFPWLSDSLARRGKISAYLGALLDSRRLSDSVDGLRIVRPEHRTNPFVGPKIYRRPNGFASDEPFSYLTIYAGSSLTLTDRVHAAVATLAYGKPAMLFSRSPRSALFERLGLADIRSRPVQLERSRLRDELDHVLGFLRSLR